MKTKIDWKEILIYALIIILLFTYCSESAYKKAYEFEK